MQDIKLFNISDMIYLITLKENNFSASNASLDLDVGSSNICKKMKKLERYVNYPIFTRGNKKYYNKGDGILGFTEQGQNLYFSIKTFIDSIMLISQGENSEL